MSRELEPRRSPSCSPELASTEALVVERFSSDFEEELIQSFLSGVYESLVNSKNYDSSGTITDRVIADLYTMNLLMLLGDPGSTTEKLAAYERAVASGQDDSFDESQKGSKEDG